MLALRSVLVIAGSEEPDYVAAAATAADAVLFDLAGPEHLADRAAARRLVERHAPAAAKAGRTVLVRVGDARSGELEADVDAVVSGALDGIVLSGAEAPQDARDVDVAIRKREMRRDLEPGGIRLIGEIDSAAGLRALPGILDAVDRHGAVALDVAALLAALGVVRRAPAAVARPARAAMEEHAMADLALAAGALSLPWLVTGRDAAAVAPRAHDLGAAGTAVHREAEVLGMNALFTPDPDTIAAARATLAAWDDVRTDGRWVGAIDSPAGPRLVDRRTARLARALVARADAVARREAAH